MLHKEMSNALTLESWQHCNPEDFRHSWGTAMQCSTSDHPPLDMSRHEKIPEVRPNFGLGFLEKPAVLPIGCEHNHNCADVILGSLLDDECIGHTGTAPPKAGRNYLKTVSFCSYANCPQALPITFKISRR